MRKIPRHKRDHPYVMSRSRGLGSVWRSVIEYYQNCDKNITGVGGGGGCGGGCCIENGQINIII